MTTPPDFGAAERDVSGLLDRLNAAYFAHIGAVGNDRVNALCELVRDAHSSLAALRAEVERITRERDEAVDALSEIKTYNLSGESGKGWKADATMQGKAVELFVASLVDLFKAKGGPNYVEASIRDVRDDKTYFVIVGPHSAKSPHKLREDAERERDTALADLAALRGWKDEAMQVLNEWESVWFALGKPGKLGVGKAAASLEALAALRDDKARDDDASVERVAQYLMRHRHEFVQMYDFNVSADWRETAQHIIRAARASQQEGRDDDS